MAGRNVEQVNEKIVDLETLLSALARVQERSGSRCQKAGGCDAQCCKVDIMQGEPSATAREIDKIDRVLKARGSFEFYEAGPLSCKFLDTQGKCKIYDVRPIDCRVHFCKSEDLLSAVDPAADELVDAYYARNEQDYMESVLLSSHIFHGEQPDP